MKHKNVSRGKKHQAHADSPPAENLAEPEPASSADGNNSGSHGGNSNHQETPPPPPSFWRNPNHWIAIATVVIAVANGLYTYFASQQWSTMSQQLTQMKDSSTQSDTALYRELRPYISVGTIQLVGNIADGSKFHGTAQVVNSGRTPAVNVTVCGDILVTIPSEPITDDYPCPNPDMPKRTDRIKSVASIGSGIIANVSSPGTTPTIQAKPGSPPPPPNMFRDLLSAGKAKVYFYGNVAYGDLINKSAIHHTNFCGLYNFEAKSWEVCDKHTGID